MALYFEIVQEIIMTILAAVVTLGGTFLALVKSGHIQIGKVKENGIESKMDILTQHYNHEISETLKRIEEKLGDIHDGIIYLKAKQKNGN